LLKLQLQLLYKVKNTPMRMHAYLDLEDLALHEGAVVLLRRALQPLGEGGCLEVHGTAKELEHTLPAWCRAEGHSYATGSARNAHKIQRGHTSVIALRSSEIAECAQPSWGLAPRGAAVEPGGPQFAFTLCEKRNVWAEELSTIYRQATNNQWSAAKDIPWAHLPKLPHELEVAVCQIMTFLTENEFAALYVPARFIPRIHPHYREVVQVLSVQVVDEARHAEAFTHRAEAGGLGLGITAASGQLSLQTLLEEPDFTTAAFLLCVMGEGTFLTLLAFLERHAPDPVTKTLVCLAHRDEARHVAFGTAHLRYALGREPGKRIVLANAVERRSRMLASISGLNPYVHDALVVLAGGGVLPTQVREGTLLVNALQLEMGRARRERLLNLGFEPDQAGQLSAFHTKNFM
jgi:TusA-related sulfurtransferase